MLACIGVWSWSQTLDFKWNMFGVCWDKTKVTFSYASLHCNILLLSEIDTDAHKLVLDNLLVTISIINYLILELSNPNYLWQTHHQPALYNRAVISNSVAYFKVTREKRNVFLSVWNGAEQPVAVGLICGIDMLYREKREKCILRSNLFFPIENTGKHIFCVCVIVWLYTRTLCHQRTQAKKKSNPLSIARCVLVLTHPSDLYCVNCPHQFLPGRFLFMWIHYHHNRLTKMGQGPVSRPTALGRTFAHWGC